MENPTKQDFKYKGFIYNDQLFGYSDIYLNQLPMNSTNLVEVWEMSKSKKDTMEQSWVWGSSISSFIPNPLKPI